MIDNETIEGYLMRMDRPVETLGEGLWRIDESSDGVPPLIVRHDAPIVMLRMKVMSVPDDGREQLYRRLLELNSNGIAFGAYAVDDGIVTLVDTLRAESLDYSELVASIESLIMAAGELYHELRPAAAAGE